MFTKQGFTAQILLILLMLCVGILGTGSYLYLKDRMASTPVDQGLAPASVDKSKYKEGEVLVTFKSGTTFASVSDMFSKNAITEFRHNTNKSLALSDTVSSTDIFYASVPVGSEQEIVSKLLNIDIVATASLRYIDSK